MAEAQSIEERLSAAERDLARLKEFVGTSALSGLRFLFVMNGFTFHEVGRAFEVLEDFADRVDAGESITVAEFTEALRAVRPEAYEAKPDLTNYVAAWCAATDEDYRRLYEALVAAGLPHEPLAENDVHLRVRERQMNRAKRWAERKP